MQGVMKEIYLDNAATTALNPRAREAMLTFLADDGNPSAIYRRAMKSRAALTKAREAAAALIKASPSEIYFTSGGTEADNWALKAVFEKARAEGKTPHMITQKTEHHAVLETCRYLEEQGAAVTYLDVDRCGIVSPAAVEAAIRPETCLISVMTANNETGCLQDVSAIGHIAGEHGVLFHTDAVQAYGHIPLDVNASAVDLMSVSAHKCGGPKGTGFLYIRKGKAVGAFLHGGAQERGRRAGTENTVGIVGFGAAAEAAASSMEDNRVRLLELRRFLTEGLMRAVPGCYLNGGSHRLPGHVNMTFPGIDGEALLIYLDMKGIAASAGSACASGSLSPSHVLTAMGLSYGDAHGTIRMTLSPDLSEEDLQFVIDTIKKGCDNIRRM